MDEKLLTDLREQAALEFVQPFAGADNRCYAIGADYVGGDAVKAVGRALAYYRGPPVRYNRMPGRTLAYTVTVIITISAFESDAWVPYAHGKEVDDFFSYIKRYAIESLKHVLAQPFEMHGKVDIHLDVHSGEQFRIPIFETMAQVRLRLRENFLSFLSERQGEGMRSVPQSILLNRFCAPADQVETTLENLSAEGFLVRTDNKELALTFTGLREAEHISAPIGSQVPTKVLPQFRQAPTDSTYDVFISYASEDKEHALALVEALDKHGVTSWWDGRQIKLGDSLTSMLNEGLARSKYGVVLISKSFVGKRWPTAELDRWMHQRYETGERCLIPLRIALSHDELSRSYPLLQDIVTGDIADGYGACAHNICDSFSIGQHPVEELSPTINY